MKLRRTKIVAFKTLDISQGCVATHLRWRYRQIVKIHFRQISNTRWWTAPQIRHDIL